MQRNCQVDLGTTKKLGKILLCTGETEEILEHER